MRLRLFSLFFLVASLVKAAEAPSSRPAAPAKPAVSADASAADVFAIAAKYTNPLNLEPGADDSRIAKTVADALDFVGVLTVELFLLPDGRLVVNELAPRTHNSGHFSFDACETSQFEQQLRAVCGLPLGSTRLLRPVAMANLLGDVWAGGEPNWASALSLPEVKLHLYGKSQPRIGRKMGHLVAFADTVEEAAKLVREARSRLASAIVSAETSESLLAGGHSH